jgi:hypothetical protein
MLQFGKAGDNNSKSSFSRWHFVKNHKQSFLEEERVIWKKHNNHQERCGHLEVTSSRGSSPRKALIPFLLLRWYGCLQYGKQSQISLIPAKRVHKNLRAQ